LQLNFARMGQSELIFRSWEISAILFVIVRVASCEKGCQHVTALLQLEWFFIRYHCVLSCKKNDFCSMALNSSENFPRNNIEGETRCVMQMSCLYAVS